VPEVTLAAITALRGCDVGPGSENQLCDRAAVGHGTSYWFEGRAEEVCVVSIAVVDVAPARPIPAPR